MAPQKEKGRIRTDNILLTSGSLFVTLGVAILLLTFGPLILEELKYQIRTLTSHTIISPIASAITPTKPIDPNFDIIIPKLGANSRIIPNVDPYNSNAYQSALTRGVAHARGTAYPGTNGNVFLFAHSSENFYEALRYNSVFYLLPKLMVGDSIELYFNKKKFTYLVTDKKLVEPTDVSYMTFQRGTPTLTLMTCWPPGTTIKRLLVFARLTSQP